MMVAAISWISASSMRGELRRSIGSPHLRVCPSQHAVSGYSRMEDETRER
jgi:hypothetical protein